MIELVTPLTCATQGCDRVPWRGQSHCCGPCEYQLDIRTGNPFPAGITQHAPKCQAIANG